MSSEKSNNLMGRLPEPGEVIDDRYRLGSPVARGGMGVIVKAKQVRTGRTVAVKLLHPHIADQNNFAGRFAREVQVATLFDHSNIVRVYDVGETEGGALYLVMEYLDGEDLKALIDRQAPMPMGEVLEIGIQIVDGLGEAHARQVVHRDIKPANVFITRTRRGAREAKLLDFGLAKLVNSGKSDLTATGVYAGTPAYIAPETLLSSAVSDEPAVDVYAAGLVILEMLTGQKVFEGDGVPQTLIQHLKKPVRIPARLAETSVGDVLKIATEKHPQNRYADADQFYEALVRAADDVDESLQLTPAEIPRGQQNTSPSLLDRLAAGPGEGLDTLQDVPGHEVYSAANDSSPASSREATAIVDLDDPPESGSSRETTAIVDRGSDRDDTIALSGNDLMIVDDSHETSEPIVLFDEVSDPGSPSDHRPPASTQTPDPPRGGFSGRTIAISVSVLAIAVVSISVIVALVWPGDDSSPSEPSLQQTSNQNPGPGPDELLPSPQTDLRPDSADAADGQIAEPPDDTEPDDHEAVAISVHIDTEPPGATVVDDEKKVGTTPLDAEFDRDELPNTVTIDKDGYESEVWELRQELEDRDARGATDLNLRLRLRQVPPPSEPTTPSPTTESPSSPPSAEAPSQPTSSADVNEDPDADDSGDDDADVDDMLQQYLD